MLIFSFLSLPRSFIPKIIITTINSSVAPPSPPSIPDPIKLLRRIHALEYAVQTLQQDCRTMVSRRQVAVREAAEQLSNLRDLLQQEEVMTIPQKKNTFKFFPSLTFRSLFARIFIFPSLLKATRQCLAGDERFLSFIRQ
jgi:hypothetical protein